MADIQVFMSVSLDGHASAGPAGRGHARRVLARRLGDESTRTRRCERGWGAPGALLFGRRTYEDF
jgi:hypothetical protein